MTSRSRRKCAGALIAGLLASACGGGGQDGRDAAIADAAIVQDANEIRDAQLRDADPIDATALPLGPEASVEISEPGAIDVYGAAFEGEDRVTVVYERYNEPFTNGRIHVATSTDGKNFAPAGEAPIGTRALRGGPSAIGELLYFIEADALAAAPSLARARFASDEDTFEEAEALPAIGGVDSILSWPRFLARRDGSMAVVFRDGFGHGKVGFSADGVSFEGIATVEASAVAQPELGEHADGSLVFTFQTPVNDEPMISFFRRSSDGTSWTDPVRVSTASSNVHDARIFERIDGGLDLYYIYPVRRPGFSMFRRRIELDGALGPEQQLTLPELGDATKPAPQRLRDGRVLLLYAEITRRALQGYPTEQILRALWFYGDAP
jgi:hypothetical protein